MSENLSNFLADLDSDPELLARFAANPEAELARTTLTPQEQTAILSRDPTEVGKVLGMAKSGEGVAKKKKSKTKKKKNKKR